MGEYIELHLSKIPILASSNASFRNPSLELLLSLSSNPFVESSLTPSTYVFVEMNYEIAGPKACCKIAYEETFSENIELHSFLYFHCLRKSWKKI